MSNEKAQQIVFLKSKRVILRPLDKSDLPNMTRWINDPRVAKYLGNYLPMRIENEEKWYEENLDNKSCVIFAIVVDGKPIGNMGIHEINWVDRTAMTGAMIGEAKYRNKGYGSEAKMLLLKYAFDTLNLRKIKSTAMKSNSRSITYSKKCGYKVEGILTKEVFSSGKYVDMIQLAVFRKCWQPLWKKFETEKM